MQRSRFLQLLSKGGGKENFMDREMIAPCGMNCTLCMARQRDKKKCGGCNGDDGTKPQHCRKCSIKNCGTLRLSASGLCDECGKKCRRLKDMDKRYRANYGMSMLENLDNIKKNGMKSFLESEEKKWNCKNCGALLCVHNPVCTRCGAEWR